MSAFGGDSWAREAQHRKRRVDDLILSSSSSSTSSPSSFKKLSNGKYACLICPNSPVLDSPLMLSMHKKGSRHIAAESRLGEKELSRQAELNKRIALSSDSNVLARAGSPATHVKCNDNQESFLWEVKLIRRCLWTGMYNSKSSGKKSSSLSLLVGSVIAMESGIEMKMLNLIQMRKTQMFALVKKMLQACTIMAVGVHGIDNVPFQQFGRKNLLNGIFYDDFSCVAKRF